MKSLICLLATVACFSAHAQESNFERYDRAHSEEIFQRMHESQQNNFLAQGQKIADKLAAINSTTVTFNPNVATEPSGLGSDEYAAGEWLLGNGGVCVLGVWTKTVYCHGAKGFSLRPTGRSKSVSKK